MINKFDVHKLISSVFTNLSKYGQRPGIIIRDSLLLKNAESSKSDAEVIHRSNKEQCLGFGFVQPLENVVELFKVKNQMSLLDRVNFVSLQNGQRYNFSANIR